MYESASHSCSIASFRRPTRSGRLNSSRFTGSGAASTAGGSTGRSNGSESSTESWVSGSSTRFANARSDSGPVEGGAPRSSEGGSSWKWASAERRLSLLGDALVVVERQQAALRERARVRARRAVEIVAVHREVVAEREPLDQLHRQVRVALEHAGVEDLHHVAVVQIGERLELPRQAARRLRIEGGARGEELQRDRLIGSPVERTIDGPGAPRAERVEHAVGTDQAGWHGYRNPKDREFLPSNRRPGDAGKGVYPRLPTREALLHSASSALLRGRGRPHGRGLRTQAELRVDA